MSERAKRLRLALEAEKYDQAVEPGRAEQILDRVLVERLPPEGRYSITREFNVNHHHSGTDARGKVHFEVTAGMYDDGRLGEIFIRGEKMGETVVGALDMVAMAISIGLQHGVPLSMFIAKLKHTRGFGDDGLTGDAEFPFANSLFDLMAKWLDKTFPNGVYVNPWRQPRQPPSDERESK